MIRKISLFCCMFFSLLFVIVVIIDPEQRMLIENTNYESIWSKNCRGVLEKRAHTIDDFMKGNNSFSGFLIHFSFSLFLIYYFVSSFYFFSYFPSSAYTFGFNPFSLTFIFSLINFKIEKINFSKFQTNKKFDPARF